MSKGNRKKRKGPVGARSVAPNPARVTAAAASTTSTSIPLDRLAPPGIAGELLVLDCRAIDARSDDERRLRDRAERKFEVSARLSKHPEANAGINADLDPDAGSSYFLAHPEAVITKIYSPLGPFEIRHNKRRELSLVTFSCIAGSAREARQKFLDGVMPFFDNLCFRANLPLFVPLVHCRDVTNSLSAFDYVAPYPSATINPHEWHGSRELAPAYALYREAKNTHSPYYKFLCYFKVLEGIYGHIRPATFKEARAKGVDISSRSKEVVPDHLELDKALVGQPIGTLFHDRFEKIFRDRVAHFILDSGSVLNVSDYATSLEFNNELLLLELCARVVLETQEGYCEMVRNGQAANGRNEPAT
jgi:hypothetical protein